MSLKKAIKKEFAKARKRDWDKIYVAVDLHETILKPDWTITELSHDYYPNAKELMQYLSSRKDICLIMYTCSHPEQVQFYLENFEKDNIHFDFINKNTEVKTNSRYGYYEDKPYFNLLFDDKAGWDFDKIFKIHKEFLKQPILLQKEIAA